MSLLVLLLPEMAEGHGFGTSANPDHYVADSSYHTWAETESSSSEQNAMMGYWLDAIDDQYGDRTQLSVGQQSYNTNTDAYWYVTSAVGVADALCVDFSVGTSVCNQARIRFNTSWVYSASAAQKRQGACHDFGHTVGFDDSTPETNTGCMSGGNQGVLSSHEIGHINAQY